MTEMAILQCHGGGHGNDHGNGHDGNHGAFGESHTCLQPWQNPTTEEWEEHETQGNM